MSTVADYVAKQPTPDIPPDELLVSEDGAPLETDWHRIEIGLFVELVNQRYAGRNDFFAGGNMFIYFSAEQARNQDFRGPDIFFVWGVSPMPLRPYWAVWKEGGRYPNLIVELLSPSTADEDLTTKKDVYEQTFRTPEYFCYDPEPRTLLGWRLNPEVYQPLQPNDKGWLWSEQLKLWLGAWNGRYLNRDATWLRLYTPEGGLIPTAEELGAQQAGEADEQRHRAEAAEAELKRLKAQLNPNND
jgi:Uma2 family endonuclease